QRAEAAPLAVERLLRPLDRRALAGQDPAEQVARDDEPGRVHGETSMRIDLARAGRSRCVADPARTPPARTSSSSPGRIPRSASSRRSFGSLSETRTNRPRSPAARVSNPTVSGSPTVPSGAGLGAPGG